MMKKILHLGTLFTLICWLPQAHALDDKKSLPVEETSSKDKKTVDDNYMGLGFSGGAISGVGFSYRQFFADNYGIKISSVFYHEERRTFFNLGTQGLWVLSDNDWLRFYVIAGLADFSFRETRTVFKPVEVPEPTNASTNEQTPTPSPTATPVPQKPTPEELESNAEKVTEIDHYVNVGAGIGMEIGRREHGLTLALELPLVVSVKNFNELNFVMPIPQLSLIYNF